MDDKSLEQAAKALTEIAKPLYDDAIQPVARQVGKSLETLGGVINVALAPVALMVHGYEIIQENLKRKLEQKLKNVPKERIVQPPLTVVGPLLDQYRFASEQPDLGELYENLLASAMDEQTVRSAHPAFVHLVSQLCPDEAKLLKVIAESPFHIPKLDLMISFKDDGAGGPPPPGTLPVIQNLTNLDRRASLDSSLTRAYLTNLARLGVIEILSDSSLLHGDQYRSLMDHPTLKEMQAKVERGRLNLTFRKGQVTTTDFGHMFLQSVVRT